MNGRTLCFTGDGKGKTTAALGLVLRAAGHDMSCAVVQFLKSRPSGEWRALSLLPRVSLWCEGAGFVPQPGDPRWEAHRAAADRALERAARLLADPRWHVVVLDEVNLAAAKNLVSTDAVVRALDGRSAGTVAVLTGRHAPPRLQAAADTVTRMECVAHGYRAGIPAQQGVEW